MSHDRAQAKEGSLHSNQKGPKRERTEMLIGHEPHFTSHCQLQIYLKREERKKEEARLVNEQL